MFQDMNAALAAYDRGAFCYRHYEWDNLGFWGEAGIPQAYVKRRWTELFDFIESSNTSTP